jgi:hypothetical protein
MCVGSCSSACCHNGTFYRHTMPRTPGPLQLKLLAALRRDGRESSLGALAAFAAGLIPDLGTRLPAQQGPSRAQYSAAARAVAALRRRGLIQTRMVASTRGRMLWLPAADGRPCPVWRFRNPTRSLFVKPASASSKRIEDVAEV